MKEYAVFNHNFVIFGYVHVRSAHDALLFAKRVFPSCVAPMVAPTH